MEKPDLEALAACGPDNEQTGSKSTTVPVEESV